MLEMLKGVSEPGFFTSYAQLTDGGWRGWESDDSGLKDLGTTIANERWNPNDFERYYFAVSIDS